MTWTGQTFSVGQILTAQQMNNLQADITAAFNKDAGAPVLANGYIVSAMFSSGAVDQTAIGSAAVGQAQIKNSNPEQSVSIPTDGTGVITITGGYWLMGWQIRAASSSGTDELEFTMGRYGIVGNTEAGPFASFRHIGGTTGSNTGYFKGNYITASPPHDLGYGQFDTFVFLLIDSNGNVIGTTISSDAPWIYNGPTNVAPDGYEKDGRPYKMVREIEFQAMQQNLSLQQIIGQGFAQKNIDAVLDKFKSDKLQKVYIDENLKHKDKDIVPHPFIGNDLTGKTVVALNPVSKLMQRLSNLYNQLKFSDDFSFADEFFYSNRLIIDNVPIPQNGGFPAAVKCVNARIK